MKTPHARQNRSLSLESLETRTLMAGNVNAVVVDGSLQVSGDQFSNGVAIEQTATNTFRVRTYSLGGSPTLLNGSTNNIQTFSGIVNDINVDMGDSRDEVHVDHLAGGPANIGRNLNLNGGAGTDLSRVEARVGRTQGGYLINRSATLVLRDSVVPRNLVHSGEGGLWERVDVGGSVAITGTAAAESISIDALTAASLSVDLGAGNDSFRLASLPQIAGDVRILMGDGEDGVRIGSLSAQNLTVNMGSGRSFINVFGASDIRNQARFSSDNQADTTSAIDEVSINGLDAADAFFVWLSSGNDRLNISNTTSPRAVLRGGTGIDALLLGEGNDIGEIDEEGFERFQI